MTTPENVTPEGEPIDPEKAAAVEGLTQAVVFALLTANEQPYPIPVLAARNIADRLYDCGIRQTDATATEIELPGWVTERVREEATPVPVEPDHYAEQETDRVTVAPDEPRRIPNKLIGVIEDTEL